MVELFVLACVASRACEYITVPIAYPDERACARQAAIVAGMVRGRQPFGGTLDYEYTCLPADRVRVAVRPEE